MRRQWVKVRLYEKVVGEGSGQRSSCMRKQWVEVRLYEKAVGEG